MHGAGRSWSDVLAEHQRVLGALESAAPLLDDIVQEILAAAQRGNRVLIFGNGGSAADAQHIAAELLGRFKRDRRALPALALTTDTSTLTAIGNDLGFDQIFARQLEGLMQPGDVAFALSTSGNSPNVLAALRTAEKRGGVTIGFTGEGGGRMAELCRHLLRVPHTHSDRIQEAHQLAYHYICERVEAAVGE